MTVAVLSGLVRPLVEPHLPPQIEPRWYTSVEEMHALAPEAEIGWFDLDKKEPMAEAKELDGEAGKFEKYFSEKPGSGD